MRASSSFKAGGHFSSTCLLRSDRLASLRCWLCQLLLSLDLLSFKTHPSAYQNLITPQVSRDLLLPWCSATCLSPFWIVSRLSFPSVLCQRCLSQNLPMEMAQKSSISTITSDTKRSLWQAIWSSSGRGAGRPWHSRTRSCALLLTEEALFFEYLMGLPWRHLFKYAPFIELLQRSNLLGKALLLLSTQQRSGGEGLTNWTALFRSLILNVMIFLCLVYTEYWL